MKVLLLHAYSASNSGDGLLVKESIDLLQESFQNKCEITIAALHPETFAGRPEAVVDASLGWYGHRSEMKTLLKNLSEFGLVVGVGGGYLRFGRPIESLKTLVAHGKQLFAASRTDTTTVYLPQSVGPLRFGMKPVVRMLIGGLDVVHVRDDRSTRELASSNTRRTPDLALLSPEWVKREATHVAEVPVLTARSVRGRLPPGVRSLANRMRPFVGYVQSTGAGNDDTRVMESLDPQAELSRDEYLSGKDRRVVVAVRLHAALMALSAGHWVIHLSYERKGFGAFQDLQLNDYVFNVNDFDPQQVNALVKTLLHQPAARADYDRRVEEARNNLSTRRTQVIAGLTKLQRNLGNE